MYEFDKDALKQMANDAKKKINSGEDIYSDLRDESELEEYNSIPKQENIHLSRNINKQEYERHEYIQNDLPKLENDVPIFEGGPLESQINLWKKQYPDSSIIAIKIVNQMFVFRTLERTEYKNLVSIDKIDQLQREEVICETCTLFPSTYTWQEMARQKAGIPSTYATIIMEHSGFTQNYGVQIL